MDSDSMQRPGSHRRVLDAFRAGEIHILLGTQMIAKGLDFPNVTLVGVVNADVALHMPDFRSAERTFQLLAQVAGRTGRGPPRAGARRATPSWATPPRRTPRPPPARPAPPSCPPPRPSRSPPPSPAPRRSSAWRG